MGGNRQHDWKKIANYVVVSNHSSVRHIVVRPRVAALPDWAAVVPGVP
jgi:hypothetical protein